MSKPLPPPPPPPPSKGSTPPHSDNPPAYPESRPTPSTSDRQALGMMARLAWMAVASLGQFLKKGTIRVDTLRANAGRFQASVQCDLETLWAWKEARYPSARAPGSSVDHPGDGCQSGSPAPSASEAYPSGAERPHPPGYEAEPWIFTCEACGTEVACPVQRTGPSQGVMDIRPLEGWAMDGARHLCPTCGREAELGTPHCERCDSFDIEVCGTDAHPFYCRECGKADAIREISHCGIKHHTKPCSCEGAGGAR